MESPWLKKLIPFVLWQSSNMNLKRKQRINRMVFFLNGFLFLLGGYTFLESGKTTFGLIQLVAGVLNLLAGFRPNPPRYLLISLFLMNILVAGSVALDYFQSGASYIQYAWLFAALMSTVALIIFLRKKNGYAGEATTA